MPQIKDSKTLAAAGADTEDGRRPTIVSAPASPIQRMQKAMTEMNLQLHHVVSDIIGATGTRIIRAIIAGERDPAVLASMRDTRCHSSAEVTNWSEFSLGFDKQSALWFAGAGVGLPDSNKHDAAVIVEDALLPGRSPHSGREMPGPEFAQKAATLRAEAFQGQA